MSRSAVAPASPDPGAGELSLAPQGAWAPYAHFGLWLWIVAATTLAWSNRFIQDDAFISFRYAEHLAQGHGLVWNPGERVEGYTNFLWTLALAAGSAMHWELAPWSMALGTLFFVLSLLATFTLALRATGTAGAAAIAVLLLGTNYTFSAYATGGLETPMQCALLTLAAATALPPRGQHRLSTARLAVLSVLSGAALLTRLDSVLVAGPIAVAVLVRTVRERTTARDRAARLGALMLPVALLLVPWLVWKLAYYGDLLPNTFYAKAATMTSLARGARYLLGFLKSYLLWPALAVALLGLPRLVRPQHRTVGGLVLLVFVWTGYVARVGGDFMEFRMLVPIMPLAFVALAWALTNVITATPVRAVLIALTLAGSWSHATTYAKHVAERVEPIAELESHLDTASENWRGIGRALARTFGNRSSVIIGTTAAGAIPYYSRLQVVDMLGLNDRWVARHGTVIGDIPGHQRLAPLHYLSTRHVNLVLSHPIVLAPGALLTRLPYLGEPPSAVLLGCRVLEIPIENGYHVLAIYLTPHPEVDAAIAREHWRSHDITPELAATVR